MLKHLALAGARMRNLGASSLCGGHAGRLRHRYSLMPTPLLYAGTQGKRCSRTSTPTARYRSTCYT